MFIKSIPTKSRKTGKVYTYYRLCESYRVGDKPRHRTILDLGDISELANNEQHKMLADRIEALVNGQSTMFDEVDSAVEKLAQKFYKEIVSLKLLDRAISEKEVEKQLHTVDIETVAIEDTQTVGGEWICLQAMSQLGLQTHFQRLGLSDEEVKLAVALIVSRAVFPASEHATVQWLQTNSSLCELLDLDVESFDHRKLYKISKLIYSHKDSLENMLSVRTNELFDIKDVIYLYDLTNTYFEGRKVGSQLAQFGRGKEKRSDCRLVTLALVVNNQGFIKYSNIYPGNIAEVKTLEKTLTDLRKNVAPAEKKPMVVLDAGCVSEENLLKIKELGFEYLCVSRTKIKDYAIQLEGKTPTVLENRLGRPIEVLVLDKQEDKDSFLYVHSEEKAKKEASMSSKFCQQFEQGLEVIRHGMNSKSGIKQINKVHARFGKLQQKYPSACQFFKVEITENKGVATEINWNKITPKAKVEDGVYFLRTSRTDLQEADFWDCYNVIREIEATFRTMKSDLQLRPVFHQSDSATEAHLFLAVLAYQVVQTIRYQLKQKKINSSWTTIRRVSSTQQVATVSMKSQSEEKIYVRRCSVPHVELKAIYDALNYTYYPFRRKICVTRI